MDLAPLDDLALLHYRFWLMGAIAPVHEPMQFVTFRKLDRASCLETPGTTVYYCPIPSGNCFTAHLIESSLSSSYGRSLCHLV